MPPHTNPNADADTGADNRLNAPKPLRLAILGFAVAMLVLTAIALACGPAAPGGQSGDDGDRGTAATAESAAPPTPTYTTGGTASPSQLATWRAIPTATPYPPGYVKPTEPPTDTPTPPLATLKAQMEQEEATLQTQEAESGAGAASTVSSRQESVSDLVDRGEYDAIARVKVLSTRMVKVPANGLDPSSRKIDARRDTVAVVEAYRGSLPEQIDIISYDRSGALDQQMEYIMGVYQFWMSESEYSSSEPWRAPFTEAELEKAGGEAYTYNSHMVWIIDEATARYVPSSHTIWAGNDSTSHLEISRGNSFSLLVADIESVLRGS